MWIETNYSDYKISKDSKWDEKIPIYTILDNKPLFDHTNSNHNTNIKDKRHAIEMFIVKDDLRVHCVYLRWVVTYQMIGGYFD
jgi:valyl-tRNA synthetase